MSASSASLASMDSHWVNHWIDNRASQAAKTPRAVWAGRIFFVTLLGAVAAALGVATHHLLARAEEKLAETQFESLTSRALVEAEATTHRRRWAGVTMAAIVGELHPDASQWPFVEFLGFERLARGLLNTSSDTPFHEDGNVWCGLSLLTRNVCSGCDFLLGVDMGFAPYLFDPLNQAPLFEDFAYGVYEKLGFPNGTGYHQPFGRGIWGQRQNEAGEKVRYHDTTAETDYGSPYTVMSPIFRTDEGAHGVLLFNAHSGKAQGEGVDKMLNCSKAREEAYRNGKSDIIQGESNCGVITELFPIVKQNGRWGAAMLRPIYPVNDPLSIVGYISCLFLVDELLQNVVGDEISGIDAVFETENVSVTFTIIHGEPIFLGQGDLHNRKYDKHRQRIELVDHDLFTDNSPVFWLSLSPNDDFASVYETNNPQLAPIVTVSMIVLTSIFFFLYDSCVRREFHAKRELLDARRQFMRFVSHETEFAKILGYDSVTVLQKHWESQPFEESSAPVSNGSSENVLQRVPKETAMECFRLTQEIEANAHVAVDVLNDLLNYDKIEQGNLQLQLKLLSGFQLVEKVIHEFGLAAISKNIRLGLSFVVKKPDQNSVLADLAPLKHSIDLPAEVQKLCLVGDPVRLTQVLRNLMSNAIKFTPEQGSIDVTVVFDQTQKEHATKQISLHSNHEVAAVYKGLLKIRVRDNGAGMTPDQLSRLFRDGIQFNSNELQGGGGTGLGLFIARGIVKQHKGSLSAVSDGLREGSTFSLSLPIWDVPDQTQQMKSSVECRLGIKISSTPEISESTPPGERSTSLRVLVVEDVKSNRKLLCRLLANKGHVCDEAENGLLAVEMVKQAEAAGNPYDSVLMDYEMPKLSGPEAAKQIRELGFDVDIIGVTGNVLHDDVAHFISQGANEVVFKPVNVDELESVWSELGVYENIG
eukprot:scaffold804_cov165-Amphora_coffeaeformis.AAC.5